MREVLATMHPWMKAVLFISIFFVMQYLAQLLAMTVVCFDIGISFEAFDSFIRNYNSPEVKPALFVSQTFYQLVGFLGAALVFAYLFTWKSVNGFWFLRNHWMILLAPLCMIAANPVIEWLITLNEWLIPEGSVLESIFKPLEDRAAEITRSLLLMNSQADLWKNILLVAVVPALCEEFVFRGVFQSQIAKATRNVHVGIWGAAILFSAIHLQFYGFLPRLVLGAFFGYLLIWTGSMWAPILAHFTNNCTSLLVHYYYQSNPEMEGSIEDQISNEFPSVLLTIALVGLITLMIKRGAWSAIKQKYLWWKKPGDSIIGDHRMN